ncbi:Protein-lysine N-methyltransferase EFM6 [Balamuthia mandrillaris]
MLGGREKIGLPNIDWKTAAFGKGKYRRKTVGFGEFDKKTRSYSELEVYVRELSIIEAGIGCAIWDAAIILSRFIFDCQDAFGGKTVLELGSGVGLPGLTAAYFADRVVLTDYIPQLLDNLEYNVRLNSDVEEGDGGRLKSSKDISQNTQVSYLNWNDIYELIGEAPPPKPDEDQPKEKKDYEELNDEQEERYRQQMRTLEAADIIIGSELTYIPESVHALVRVLKKYLKDDGIFYEVLSDDRDGVSLFLEKIDEADFGISIVKVPENYLGNYGTSQREETYKLYAFWKGKHRTVQPWPFLERQ